MPLPNSYQTFVFHSYDFEGSSHTLRLRYSLDDAIHFEEKITFNLDIKSDYDQKAFDRACFTLWLMAGISYFKAALPPKIKILQGKLTAAQKDFFEETYLNGLGQFFYENKIDPHGKINFPITSTELEPAPAVATSRTLLLGFGGGKDSIVAGEILKSIGLPLETYTLGHHNVAAVSQILGAPHHTIERILAPEILELNRQGALNGHVPITAITSLSGICAAILLGAWGVVVGNEHSADEGNTEYAGLKVNHQYSKTLKFERDLQNYIHTHISPSLVYFSPIRPLSSLRIVEIFAKHYFDRYAGYFSSCNQNFLIDRSDNELTWCGKCSKCAYVFAALSPFLPKEKLLSLFGGRNLFLDPELTGMFQELLGTSGIKPLECVGQIAEVRTAFMLAKQSGQSPELAKFVLDDDTQVKCYAYDFRELADHAIPSEFPTIVSALKTL